MEWSWVHEVAVPAITLVVTGYAGLLRMSIGRMSKDIEAANAAAQVAKEQVVSLRTEVSDKYQRRDAAEATEQRLLARLDEIAGLLHQLMMRERP